MFDKIRTALIAAVVVGVAAALDYMANDQGFTDALGPLAPVAMALIPVIAGYLRSETSGYGAGVPKS